MPIIPQPAYYPQTQPWEIERPGYYPEEDFPQRKYPPYILPEYPPIYY